MRAFLTLVLILFFLRINAQSSIQAGFGFHLDRYSTNSHLVDSLYVSGKETGDDLRPSLSVTYNFLVKNKLNIESGIKGYASYYTYFVGKLHPDFGIVKKVGGVKANIVNVPLNIEYKIGRYLYGKAGLSASFSKLTKNPKADFIDMPEINET